MLTPSSRATEGPIENDQCPSLLNPEGASYLLWSTREMVTFGWNRLPTDLEARLPMPDAFTNLVYHVVFSTKERAPLITDAFREQLYAYIGGVIRGQRGILLEIGGMPDHVHILARFRSDVSIAEMVRLIKANSSKWMNERSDRPERFQWQEGYGAFSVSESRVPAVRAYLQNQREHHARVSLRDELVALLERHRIAFDERYLLG